MSSVPFGLAEGDQLVAGLDQRCADRGHLAVGRGAHAGLLIDDRWVEQCEPAWTGGGAVSVMPHRCRTQRMPAARVGRSGRGEDEDRIEP